MKSHANNQQRTALAGWEDDGGAPRMISGRPVDEVEWQFRSPQTHGESSSR